MPFFRRESIRASLQRMLLLALPVFILFGCLNYDEQSTLRANGSGEIRLLYGFPKDGASSVTLDTDKAETIRQAIDSEPGLKVLSKLDSNTAQVRWFGYLVHFDSLTALSPLQNLLPLKGMFGDLAIEKHGDTTTLTRSVHLLPATSGLLPGGKDSKFTWTLSWTVPGTVVEADSAAKWAKGTDRVTWNLPTDGSQGDDAALKVRWTTSKANGSASMPMKWIWIGGILVLAIAGVAVALKIRSGRPKGPDQETAHGENQA